MGTIDTFRDFVGNFADDVKEAFDDLLDRPNRDDDCDWWDDDCDDDEDDWLRQRRGSRRGRRRPRQLDRRGRRGRPRRRIVESGSRHPSLAESSRGGVDPELTEQVRQLASTVEALRASLSAQNSPGEPENRT